MTAVDKSSCLHYGRIRKILVWILFLNWAVALAKIAYGFISRCSSMSADGYHSLADGASNIVCLVGIYIAQQPKDSEHPYGHRKYETFFSLGIATLLFIAAFNLTREGVLRFFRPVTPQIDLLSFVVMAATLCVNFAVMRYEYKKGKELQSDLLVSDSLHTKADILTSVSVIITLVVIKLGYPIIDPIATLLISLFIAHAGLEIMREGSDILCDRVPIADVKRIEEIVLTVKGVTSCHQIRTRGRPDEVYVDLHVEVNPSMHIDRAHRISEEIEEAIKKGIQGVADVVVHMEPKGNA